MFRVSARTVLQLGSELISSDAVAFYELVKNAFDARADRVDIDVAVRLPHEIYGRLRREAVSLQADGVIEGSAGEEFVRVRDAAIQAVDSAANGALELRQKFTRARTWEQLLVSLDESNFIDIVDAGSGMSRQHLKDVYLWIGTPTRLLERKKQDAADPDNTLSNPPILGEKGIGRLSVMRLGWRLLVKTATREDAHWNLLAIDWRDFSSDDDKLIEDVVIKPTQGPVKERRDDHGTRIHITALKSRWSEERLNGVALEEFSRFTDPFAARTVFPVSLRFNDEPVTIPHFEDVIFSHAHAEVRAEYTLRKKTPLLTGKINYLLRNREKTFSIDLPGLHSICGVDADTLRTLGPFRVHFFWFNRRILQAVEGIGDKRQVQDLVNRWSGGLMVYRDGFRVKPYGSPDDDWLDLDRRAWAAAGYKINRKQIIGKVDISARANPALTDQTNREGLRDSDEKQALVSLLKNLMESEFRAFIDDVDAELRAQQAVTFDDLHARVESEERRLQENVRRLLVKYPVLKDDPASIRPLEDSLVKINTIMREAEELAESFSNKRSQVVNLAGLGMMVEILAHELNRAAENTLATLSEADVSELTPGTGALLKTLKSQMTTLQKRLRILDPLSTSGRQVKEGFDLIAWVEEIVNSHEAQFRRHRIACKVTVEPSRAIGGFKVRMVKGMIVQVLENLISNSVYWLKQQVKLEPTFKPRIDVLINTKTKQISLTDNGPGVMPERKDEIFQPFVTSKPPGAGKGLGLYIAREIATYHDAALSMSDATTSHKDRLNTFVLTMGAKSP